MNAPDAARYRRLKGLFEQVSDVPEAERDDLLQKLAGGDAELLGEARSLLIAADAAETEMPVPETRAFDAWFGTPTAEVARVGRRFGPFRLISELAQGGMGIVYEAEQDEPKRRIALKVLKMGLDSERARERFEREARVLGNLSHPGIAALHGVGTHVAESGERVPYLVMELVQSALPVTKFVAQMQLSSNARLRLFVEIADAVASGHQRGVIHRDLKPDNVLVDAEGRPKVIDFGIARVTAGDLDQGRITETGMVMGTLGYIAPEQLSERGGVEDVRMDVYALGVILYEMLTGHSPLDLTDMDIVAAARATIEKRPTPPTKHVPEMPHDIVLILNKALAKDPDARYASVDALARDVSLYLNNAPIQARAPSFSYQLRLFTRRHRVGVTAAAIVALALAGATWFSVAAASREARQRRVAEVAEQQATEASQRAVGMLVGSQDMVSDLFEHLYADLAKVPGTLPARLALVERLEHGTAALRHHAADDQRFTRTAALLHKRVAGLNFRMTGDHLGRPTRALESLARARELFQKLLAREDIAVEKRIDDRMVLALVAGDEAAALDFLGETEQAQAGTERAIKMLSALVQERPDDMALRNNLASQYSRLARIAFQSGAEDDALAHARAGLSALPKTMSEAHGDAVNYYGNRGYLESLLGEILRSHKKWTQARTHQEASLAAFQSEQRINPDGPSILMKLAQAEGELGMIALRSGDRERAQTHLLKAVALARAQAKRNPEDRRAQESLAIDIERVAELYAAQGKFDLAVQWQKDAIAMDRRTRENPDALSGQIGLRIGLNKLGGYYRSAGKPAKAAEAFERTHRIAQAMIQNHPRNLSARVGWAESLDALGIVRWSQAQNQPTEAQRRLLSEAMRYFEASLGVYETLIKEQVLPTSHTGVTDQIGNKVKICQQNLAALDKPTTR